MISVALFDLDDTLFAHRLAVRDGIAAHIASTIPGVDASAHLDRWDELEELHYHRYLSGELDYLGQRRARASDFMTAFGVEFAEDHHAETWFETYLLEYVRAWTLFDDAIPCLDQLAGLGVRVGIITNGIPSFQAPKLETLALAERMEHVITSGEFGAAKPDPSIFLHACALFGVEPGESLYVGDRLHTDAIGASAVGMSGVWLDRGSAATADDLAAARASDVRIISTLAEVMSGIA